MICTICIHCGADHYTLANMQYCKCLHSGKCPGCDAKHNGCVHNSIFLYRANGVLFFQLMTLQWVRCPEENTSKSAR